MLNPYINGGTGFQPVIEHGQDAHVTLIKQETPDRLTDQGFCSTCRKGQSA